MRYSIALCPAKRTRGCEPRNLQTWLLKDQLAGDRKGLEAENPACFTYLSRKCGFFGTGEPVRVVHIRESASKMQSEKTRKEAL